MVPPCLCADPLFPGPEGYTREEAIEHTLTAIHPPFWGYAYEVCKWVFRFAAVSVLLIALIIGFGSSSQYIKSDDTWSGITYAPFHNALGTRYGPLAIQQKDSGYTYTLTDATLWKDPNGSHAYLYLRLRVQGLPWLSEPTPAISHIWMEDDLGNRYYYEEKLPCSEDGFYFIPYHTGPLTWEYEIYTYEFTVQGARWVDIHYDRDGRNMIWHLDLTGGGNA